MCGDGRGGRRGRGGKDVLDDLFLARTEGFVAKTSVQNVSGGCNGGVRGSMHYWIEVRRKAAGMGKGEGVGPEIGRAHV